VAATMMAISPPTALITAPVVLGGGGPAAADEVEDGVELVGFDQDLAGFGAFGGAEHPGQHPHAAHHLIARLHVFRCRRSTC
jgi:hypothetical protein